MAWISFRASRADNTIYWQVVPAPVDGDDRLNIEIPDPMVNNAAAIERLIASAIQAEFCGGCDGATVSLGQPWGGAGYHSAECPWYYGWTVRDQPWATRNLTPEPTPETPPE
ncbi:hypothetical protein AB0P21_09795 [Kribbella sp. NPDC056861]|uniref:hypothetical protein n=1 Tax=Kribbella sp. NPDC056861 TaxID=3154857 RepID=UPI00344230A7